MGSGAQWTPTTTPTAAGASHLHQTSAALSASSMLNSAALAPGGVAGTPTITTTAGTGTAGDSGDGGAATQAPINAPPGVAVDGQGNIFLADPGDNAVREVSGATELITTVAGTGTAGVSGDGGPATQAQLSSPWGLAVDSSGNLYIADTNNHVVREVLAGPGGITASSVITTVAGTGIAGNSGDGGLATQAQLRTPQTLAVDQAGNLYISDIDSSRLREVVARTGMITTVAGGGPGCPQQTNTLGDNCPAAQAQTGAGYGVAVDPSGDIFIADANQGRLREVIASTGIITTVTGASNGWGVAVDGAGHLFYAETGTNTVRAWNASSGSSTLVAGTGTAGYNGDGIAATQAELNQPRAIAFDRAGDLIIADTTNNRIREVAGVGLPAPLQSGTIPWHPHQSVRLSDGLSASVDLADGHVDVHASDLHLPGQGMDLSLDHTWDSTLAQSSITSTAGQGWLDSLSPSIGGVLTGTVVYTSATGATWPFTYTGDPAATDPYTSYTTPPGLPWQLATSSSAGYTLTNVLSGETLTFDAQGRYLRDTDSYGNWNAFVVGSPGPPSETNSGGRAFTSSYQNGLLADVQSPLWSSSGGAQGQHVTYGYNSSGQLTTLTRGAGTSDARTATFGYSGVLLTGVTTPANHAWALAYDAYGRVGSITSPVSGTVGQAGYTPAYTTAFFYQPRQTQVVQGYGTSAALTTTYTLDGQGQATAVQDGLGNSSAATYDADHDVTSGTDANGNTTTYKYLYAGPSGSVGLVTEIDKPAISAFSFGSGLTPVVITNHYDPGSYDLIETDSGNAGITRYAYDGHHAVITTTQMLATGCDVSCQSSYQWRGSVNTYDQYGQLTSTVDGRGVVVSPDANGTASLDPSSTVVANATHRYTYSPYGDLTSSSTPPITTLQNGTSTTAPATTNLTYNADGQLTQLTSPNGTTTTYSYDHLGRAIQVTRPAVALWNSPANTTVAPIETVTYDGDGNIVRRTDGNGDVTQSSDDPLGRVTAETDPVSGTTLMTYTATERAAVQDPQGNVTTASYDADGRLLSTTDLVHNVTQYAYDMVGNTTTITGGDGTTVFTVDARSYDAWNRVVQDSVSGPGTPTQTTQTAYDYDGNVVQVEQPNGDVTYTSYDLADQPTNTEIDPAAVTGPTGITREAWTYDAAGNVTQHLDFDGRLSSTTLDGANRAIQTTDGSGTSTITTTLAFDPDGNAVRRTVQAPSFAGVVQTDTYTATVNAADWPITAADSATPGQQQTTVYGYDGAGRLRQQSVLNNTAWTITTLLNAAGQATAIGENIGGATPYTSSFGYTNELPTAVSLPGSVQETGQYDVAGRLTHVGATGPTHKIANPLNSSYDYGYTPLGWTAAVTTALNGGTATVQTLTHDALGRLKTAQSGSTTQNWTYDGNGNLTSSVTGSTTTTYGYNNAVAPNELQTLSTPGQPTTYYGYNGTGATSSITNTGTISTGLSYDSRARLQSVTLKDGTRVTLSYNTAGLRASYTVTKPGQTQPSVNEQFQYRGSQVGQAVVVSGTSTYTDTYLYTQTGAPLELVRQSGGTTSRYWYVLDGRSNVVALTDSTGNVVDRYSYDLWGNPTSTSETVAQPLRYAGYWYDRELGWYWVQVRSYDPALKRWLQPDPSAHDGIHTYAYGGDDPVDATDPSGFGCKGGHDILSGIGAALCNGATALGYLPQWLGIADHSLAYGNAYLDYITAGGPLSGHPPTYAQAYQDHVLQREIVLNAAMMAASLYTGGEGASDDDTPPVAEPPAGTQEPLGDGDVALGPGDRFSANDTQSSISPGRQSFLDPSDPAEIAGQNMEMQDEYYDIVSHGRPGSIMVQQAGRARWINASEFAKLIRANPDYSGQPIRLVACNVGECAGGFAQQLADELDVRVLAPSDTLYVRPDGSTYIGSDMSGDWYTYYPASLRRLLGQ